MDTVLLTKTNFEEIRGDLKEIKTKIKNITSPSEHFIDNDTFTKLMGVSTRTAQNWRIDGLIGFSQTGKKIYYRMSDIDQFLKDHHREPFAPPSDPI